MTSTTHPVSTDVEHFESIYIEAAGDAARIPWADQRANPALVTWLNAVAPSLVRCGSRVAVVGCGLGDDVRELIKRGYEVLAFDCSPTAVEWAKRNDPDNAHCYHVADVFDAPARWRHRYELVVEINTIQALTPDTQQHAMSAISNLLAPRGYLLVICRGSTEQPAIDDGPPWALTKDSLIDAANQAGLVPEGDIAVFLDNEVPPVKRMRALFKRQ